jgi:hypothetical protein
MARVAKKGKYKGEVTLKKESYPVTKKGKLSCKRVRSAIAYGVMHNDTEALKKGGIRKYISLCDINTRYFG